MALQTLPGLISWPRVLPGTSGSPTIGNIATLDAAGEYVAFIVAAREAMTISHVGWRTGTATGSPTADVRIETVDATNGQPTGTLWGTNTNKVTSALSANTFALQALTASASIAVADVFAVKIAYNSGTSFIVNQISSLNAPTSGLPYLVTNTGSPAKAAVQVPTTIALGSGATSFYSVMGAFPASSAQNNLFNNTNSAKRGAKFQIPFKCRCVGMRIFQGTQTGDVNASLFDNAGSELGSSSTAYDMSRCANTNLGSQEFFFDNAVELSPATTYYVAVEPTSATNSQVATITLPSADYRTAYPGGTNFHYATFASGSWTDVTTEVPLIELLIDKLDDGVGGGGGLAANPLGGFVV